MTRVEHVESAPLAGGDPVDAIRDLANKVRATSIAADARRVLQQLDSARLLVLLAGRGGSVRPILERFVGAIGMSLDESHATAFRFGRLPHAQVTFRDGSRRVVPVALAARLSRATVAALDVFVDSPLLRSGVAITVVPSNECRLNRRADLVVTTGGDADEVSRMWPGAGTLVVDSSRADDIDKACAFIHGLAIESGAVRVETQAEEHQRCLCVRLGHHLFEQHRALIRSEAAMLARINALTIARVLAESVLEARTRQPDAAREALASWLSAERTKFLMATKADALLALHERLAHANQARCQLRASAANASHAIAVELLAELWRRVSAEAEKPIAALSCSLLADLDISLGDLGEHLSPQALMGFDQVPIRGLRRDVEWPAPSGDVAHVVDRVGLSSRQRIESAADSLVATLTNGSRRVIERVLFDYDLARTAIEQRFCELLDSALHSVQVASELAQEARAGGADSVAQARDRIAQWSTKLDRIMTGLA